MGWSLMTGGHPLRQAFDRVERSVGAPLERLMATPASSQALLGVGRAWMSSARRVEDVRSGLMHFLGLPTHRDIRRLSGRLARLQSSLEEVAMRLEDQAGDR